MDASCYKVYLNLTSLHSNIDAVKVQYNDARLASRIFDHRPSDNSVTSLRREINQLATPMQAMKYSMDTLCIRYNQLATLAQSSERAHRHSRSTTLTAESIESHCQALQSKLRNAWQSFETDTRAPEEYQTICGGTSESVQAIIDRGDNLLEYMSYYARNA
jgi:hypothetical protein